MKMRQYARSYNENRAAKRLPIEFRHALRVYPGIPFFQTISFETLPWPIIYVSAVQQRCIGQKRGIVSLSGIGATHQREVEAASVDVNPSEMSDL